MLFDKVVKYLTQKIEKEFNCFTIRYMDDIVIASRTKVDFQTILKFIENIGFKLNYKKTNTDW